ncbi:hypothetical protein AGDE_16248 [Angomonas deanei]|nr:hypothetical protein AGDE_16248 [Angomonas deanei]|eukprot:EPY17453.1 hypothetical protein AGDE_16248 [Angomonas deanei]
MFSPRRTLLAAACLTTLVVKADDCMQYNGTMCTACKSGHYLLNGRCDNCPEGCAVCRSSNICDQCEPGKRERFGLCFDCPMYCTECSDVNTCLACADGSFLKDADCHLCPIGCGKCRSAGTCDECDRFSTFDGHQCAFKRGPLNCVTNTKGVCTLCDNGHYLEDGRCPSCPDGCEECTSANTCDRCEANKKFDGVSCVYDNPPGGCPANCAFCKTSDTCKTCDLGYYVKDGKCKKCIDGCEICYDSTSCHRCEGGRVISKGRCGSAYDKTFTVGVFGAISVLLATALAVVA